MAQECRGHINGVRSTGFSVPIALRAISRVKKHQGDKSG